MIDFATRRRVMVDTQVRPSDVTKFPIIEALLSVPREIFVPPNSREIAYAEGNISLGNNRVLLDPRTLAKMLDALNFTGDELVLDIGGGLGYSSAVTAKNSQAVVLLEENSEWIAEAPTLLAEASADNVVVQEGKLVDGAPEFGPYDVIILQGGIVQLPDAIIGQLKTGGRVAAIFVEQALGLVRIGHNYGSDISWRFAFHASAPILPGFEAVHEFEL
ncbi:MAG: protein-L-isoaspartate O-methyltransferase [Aestuariivita sp.]|nr:protein-L-isoaspartate O-methyltransferase [Aestuariivita sp.]MCY4346705.1 protein-L-isoaspartate O-methyltransferase [Aestuariivita sp.]